MFISDKKSMRDYADRILESAGWCLAASALCAIFGGVYELFSHGVYSGYMLFSFVIPLLLGAGPASLIGLYVKTKAEEEGLPGTEELTTGCGERIGDMIEDMEDYAEIIPDMAGSADGGDIHRPAGICIPGAVTRNAWFSGIAALTVGCIFRGILEIYGTTNRLLAVYPAAAAVLMCAALAVYLLAEVTFRRAAQRRK